MNETDFEKIATGISQSMSLNQVSQQKIKDWMIKADRKTYVYGYTDYLKLDVRNNLKNITIPVTILTADKPFGKEMVTQTYKNQYANLSDYNLIVADNAAHFIMFDQPNWFLEQIQHILSAN